MATIATRLSHPSWDRLQRGALLAAVGGFVAFGAVALAIGFLGNIDTPRQFFLSYLVAYNFWLSIALGSLVILMLQFVSGGMWGYVIRRALEAGSSTLIPLAVLFLPILFGARWLYEWAVEQAAGQPLPHEKGLYLNVPFFIARAVVYFTIWLVLTFFLLRWSHTWDQQSHPASPRRFRLLSAPGLALYGLTITFASIDWVMSLEPEWYSTIFPVLFAVGQVLSAFAFVIAVVLLLADYPPLSEVVTPHLMRDLGNLLLAFVMFWAYMGISQYLLMWIANIPEEITWYLRRTRGGWEWLALLLIIAQFGLPFLLLLSRDVKEKRPRLLSVCGLILLMRFLDVFWLIEPAHPHEGQYAFWLLDVAATVFLGGIWMWWFLWQLQRRPLLPVHGPLRAEAAPHD